MSATEREIVLDIEGMTCASCVNKVERALGDVEGVAEANVNLVTRTATVRRDAPDAEPLIAAVRRVGYGARLHEGRRSAAEEAHAYATRLAIAVILTVPLLVVTFGFADADWSMPVAWALATPVVFVAGWPFHRSALRSALHGTTTMDTLISIGSLAAYALSTWSLVRGDEAHYFDTAAVIVTLILLGKVLEARARRSAGDASRALLERGAKEATLLEDGVERRIPIDDLLPGAVVVVRPGEKIPADGVVREGTSWVDLSLLTGESTPVDVGDGDEVVGGAINGDGRLVVFVTTVGANTKLASIVRLLEQAQGSKAPVQRLADRVSSVFVPIVLVLALATFAGWMMVGGATATTALLHAIAVVVIACPCALGLATPAAIMAGTGRAAELGVFFKNGAVLEATHGIDTVLLDKTGTLTRGEMTLAEIVPLDGVAPDEILALAAAAEMGSEHPIARAVVAGARGRGLEIPSASAHRVEPGAGASAVVEGAEIAVARPAGLAGEGLATLERVAGAGQTPFAVRRGDRVIGLVSVRDEPKADAADAVARLRRLGAEVEVVTGDRAATARTIGATLGVDDVVAEVLPAGKVERIERLRAGGRHVAFVGDGINDAPALAAADVGIAMGTGTDVAIAAADVRLLGGAVGLVPTALELSRRTYRVIRQNLFWAFAYNVVMIPVAIAGLLDPAWAAAAMALSSVTVVLNALRLRGVGRSRASGDAARAR